MKARNRLGNEHMHWDASIDSTSRVHRTIRGTIMEVACILMEQVLKETSSSHADGFFEFRYTAKKKECEVKVALNELIEVTKNQGFKYSVSQ